MRTLSIQVIVLLGLAQYIVSFEVKPFDSAGLFNLFVKSNTFNTIRLDKTLPLFQDSSVVDKRITLQTYLEENCAIRCLRNILCVRYNYDQSVGCQIYLKANYSRQNNFVINQTKFIENNLECNLQTCSSSVYCSQSLKCLCPLSTAPSLANNCGSKVVYELTEWSAWSTCSASCDDGFLSRNRKCTRKYIDTTSNAVIKTEPADGFDWLCGAESRVQVNTCKLDSCRIYGEWSAWSTCSRICGGFSTRTRDCLPGKTCDQKYLKQAKVCGLEDCSSYIIKLDRTEDLSSNRIIKRGILKLRNTLKNVDTRIFTQNNDKSLISNIGKVVCKEFNFDNLNDVNVVPANNLRAQFKTDREYSNFIFNESISGLQCNGDEITVKDCKTKQDSKASLFELEIECLYNGYWSSWDSWSDCSVTCGAGAKRRFRLCNDPQASIAEIPTAINGTSCNENNGRQLTNCVMPRCESQLNV